jgi:hypothetical protein
MGASLRFLQENNGFKADVYLNGEEVVKAGVWQLKDKSICIRGGTQANSVLINNFNVDSDGDSCLPLTCVENTYFRIRTSIQEIKFICNTQGNSGISDMLKVNFIFHLSRENKTRIEELVNQMKSNRQIDRSEFQTERKSLEDYVNNYNEYTVRWNNMNKKEDDLVVDKVELEKALSAKKDEKKKLETDINALAEECRKKDLALVELNKKISAVNREIENLDVQHTSNSDEILGLDEFVKNKEIAIADTKVRISEADKLFNEALTLLKQLCPKSAHEIDLISKNYSDRKDADLRSTADLITSVEPQ